MALLTRNSLVGIDAVTAQKAAQLSGLYAGEDLDMAAPCFIKSDGKVYMSTGNTTGAGCQVDGWTPRAVTNGQPVTLFGPGVIFHYGASLTPGARYYLSTTAGRLDTAKTTGDTLGIAQAISARNIRTLRFKSDVGV